MTGTPAEAIVIGGGIVGANCALQLARKGVDEVVLLEADSPASKASGLAAGHLTIYRHERFGDEASRFGRNLYESYEQSVDELSLHRDDAYSIAYSEEGADYLKTDHASSTIDSTFLTPEAFGEREPDFATDDVTGAVHYPEAVFTDPKQLTLAAHAVAQDEGVRLNQATVQGFNETARNWSVVTDAGTYEAPVIVVAAGVWTKSLLQTAGADVALRPRTSQIAILDPPAPLDLPIFGAPDFSVYGRTRTDGRILFGGGTNTPIDDIDSFRNRSNVTFLRQLGERAPQLIPALEKATLHDDWAGRVSATPDRYPYIGETSIEGLYVCGGFNGEGISNSPFGARLLAELVVGEEPIVDPSPFDPTRFDGEETFEISDAVEWWADR
ncbi:MAG: NAD(P)/FAD-dependent oxidoreductase [Halobacteriota archaeon]